MAGQHIDYEALAQDAMRGVVKAVLGIVAQSGLNGDHHFYIAFNTQAPGVSISKRLKEKYPSEMTIVLQHRFWDLAVLDERFEVKLTFDGIPERLDIPYRAVKVFYDPSVPYGLQFEESELSPGRIRGGDGSHRGEHGIPGEGRATENGQRPRAPRSSVTSTAGSAAGATERADKRRGPATARPAKTAGRNERVDEPRPERKLEAVPDSTPEELEASKRPSSSDETQDKAAGSSKPQPVLTEVKPDGDGPKNDGAGAKVVDLSKFRKK